MVNEAIRVGLDENITSKLTLRNRLYKQFKNQFHTSYISMAVFKAHALLKNYRKTSKRKPDAKIPRIQNLFLVADKHTYRIIYNHVLIPTRPKEFVGIPLNHYITDKLKQQDIKLGTLTITQDKLAISYSKEVWQKNSQGAVGIDMNLDNITIYDTDGNTTVYSTRQITKIKQTYRNVKSHFKRNDHKIRKKIFQKYGRKERNKTESFLHNITKKIASQNKTVFLEKLTGMNKMYKRKNGQDRNLRYKLTSWPRFIAQQQIKYKSEWNENLVYFVNPRGTSSKCAACEAKILEEHRMIRCPQCGLCIDRDVNAARNILARGLQKHPQGARLEPDAVQGEAMKQSKDVKQIAPSQIATKKLSKIAPTAYLTEPEKAESSYLRCGSRQKMTKSLSLSLFNQYSIFEQTIENI